MRKQQSQTQIDHHSDEDCTASSNQILERVQPDRVTITKPEEDRRRRTIIVEKKNGTFGFTLQSYGIHYKKEQEIEMITYVDYVDYDGPAYRAGMREGDVILSINGNDMEKADHKTLVNFIKNCDSRMRMVVLFEDCVRKVELHMRYIQLQRILQNKMNELERLCIRERQVLEGKWKTHSLPARKKASHSSESGDPETPTQPQYLYCRPTVSTEDVAKIQQKQPPPQAAMLAYQYLDPRYRYVLQPPIDGSGEYLLSFKPPCYQNEQHHFVVKTHCDATPKYNKANQTDSTNTKIKKSFDSCHSYVCNPCIQVNSNGDNTSLEAYDLASPCCDPHCVPNARRRSRNQKDIRRRDSRTEETQTQTEDQQQKVRPYIQTLQGQVPGTHQPLTGPRKYLQFGAGLVSQCSLHSCTSSEISGVAPTTTGESTASYSTSLSTDTLYWDGSGEMGMKQPAPKPVSKHEYQRYQPVTQNYEAVYQQFTPAKPKSWDNLATKAFGGYGFGYGYLDTTKCSKPSQRTHSNKMNQGSQYFRVCGEKCGIPTSCSSQPSTIYGNCTSQRRYIPPTKSTENLLSVPKYTNEVISDSTLPCECVEPVSPGLQTAESRFFQSPRQSVVSPTDPTMGYYSSRRMTRSDIQRISISTSSEATRL